MIDISGIRKSGAIIINVKLCLHSPPVSQTFLYYHITNTNWNLEYSKNIWQNNLPVFPWLQIYFKEIEKSKTSKSPRSSHWSMRDLLINYCTIKTIGNQTMSRDYNETAKYFFSLTSIRLNESPSLRKHYMTLKYRTHCMNRWKLDSLYLWNIHLFPKHILRFYLLWFDCLIFLEAILRMTLWNPF